MMMVDRPRVLFVHISPQRVSFIQRDFEILSKHFEVREVLYRSRFDLPKLAGGTLWADVTYSFFAWDHAAWAARFSKFFGRKSIVCVGGFDVVHMPEISYGNLLRPRPAARTLYAIRNSHVVLAVSDSLRSDAMKFSGRNDIKLLYHGFDVHRYSPSGNKERIALTVGSVNRSNLKRKGIETFIKAAKHAPDISFHLIGRVEDSLLREIKVDAPTNLKIFGEVDFPTLLKEMRRAMVYVQVSAHEGFGCSLAEAMLCGAIPVVTKAGAIPEVVGDVGIYVPLFDPEATAKAVIQATGNPDGNKTRQRIVEMFPLEKRERNLVSSIWGAYEKGG